MCKKQCNISLKCQHSHVLFFLSMNLDWKKKKNLSKSAWLSKSSKTHAIWHLTHPDWCFVCPASPSRIQCLSSGCLHATSCCLTRPPATLHRHGRVLSPPFPMEISLLIHGAAVTAALLWKMMRAQGLSQKEPIPFTPGLWQSRWPSVGHLLCFKWASLSQYFMIL